MSRPTHRWQVQLFADLMETELRANDHKGGWQREMPEWLLKRLEQEVRELRRAVRAMSKHAKWKLGEATKERIARLRPSRAKVRSESADVANFAMMVADVVAGLGD